MSPKRGAAAGKISSIYRALLPSDDGTRRRRAEKRMCHADSPRAAAAAAAVEIAAKPASEPL